VPAGKSSLARRTSGRDNPPVVTSLAHQPAIAFFLIVVVVAGAFTAIANLRNAGVWLLQISGRRAEGVVESVEFAAGEKFETLRRPIVAFTTGRGERIVSRPALFRKSTALAKGMTVSVRYAASNPRRMVVPGFGFRYREPVYASIGATTAIAISVLYFQI
jgi:hypothetical protein